MSKQILFDELYHQYFKSVYSYFASCFYHDIVDDLSQKTFMNIWRYLIGADFFAPDNWKAWIFKIAVNVKNDFLREKYNNMTSTLLSEEDSAIYHSEEDMMEQIAINKAFSMLKLNEKELLLLIGNGLNSTEIGEILNLPSSTVRSRLVVAKKNLCVALKECGVNVNG